jgi:hypothetical protein
VIEVRELVESRVGDETHLYLRQGEHTSWRVIAGDEFARVEWLSKLGWVEIAAGVVNSSGQDGGDDRLRLLALAINLVQPDNKDRDIVFTPVFGAV